MLIGGFLLDVIIAKHAGVCFGAQRATDMAFKAARDYRNHVYTIGPRIHNAPVVKQLREAAVIVKEGIGDIAGEQSHLSISRPSLPSVCVRWCPKVHKSTRGLKGLSFLG